MVEEPHHLTRERALDGEIRVPPLPRRLATCRASTRSNKGFRGQLRAVSHLLTSNRVPRPLEPSTLCADARLRLIRGMNRFDCGPVKTCRPVDASTKCTGRTITHMLRPVRTGAALVCAVTASTPSMPFARRLVAENDALVSASRLPHYSDLSRRHRAHASTLRTALILEVPDARLNTAARARCPPCGQARHPPPLASRPVLPVLWHHKSRRRGARGRLRRGAHST